MSAQDRKFRREIDAAFKNRAEMAAFHARCATFTPEEAEALLIAMGFSEELARYGMSKTEHIA